MLPQMRRLAGDFPEECFFRVEDTRRRSNSLRPSMDPLPGELDLQLPFVDRSLTDNYLDQFFSLVHPFYPIFDRDDLIIRYEEVMNRGLGFDNESAFFLAVVALGATASDPIDNTKDSCSGDVFIRKALAVFMHSWTVTFSGDLLLSQGLVLCALYFAFAVEPLTSWRFIHMASTSIQQLLLR